MKGITKFIFILIILSVSLLSGCSSGQATDVTTPPNADHLAKFNKDEFAVLRGYFAGGGYAPPSQNGNLKEDITLAVPVKVDGIKTSIAVPFTLRFETEILSSMTTQTNVREYHKANPFAHVSTSFPSGALLEVTFAKKGGVFEAISIHEVNESFTLFQIMPVIKNVVSTDFLSRGRVVGSVTQKGQTREGEVTWMVAIPIKVHDIQANIFLLFQSAPDTQVITSTGVVPSTSHFSWEHIEIEFSRNGDRLIAHQITEIP